jgi:DNA-binding HxlR family transcriptional regulator
MKRESFCPYYHHAVELIGRRWTGVIIGAMLGGRTRFSEISHAVPGLSDRLLSERLKELEQEGIVVRTVIPDTPVRIEYRLTEKGEDLGQAMDAISAWAHRWLSPAGDHHVDDDEEKHPVAAGVAEPLERVGY